MANEQMLGADQSSRPRLASLDAQAFGHFFVEESLARTIRLYPFAIDNKLRNGALAGVADDFFGGSGGEFDIDLVIGDVMLGQKTFGFTTIGAPESRVKDYIHALIVKRAAWLEGRSMDHRRPTGSRWRSSQTRSSSCIVRSFTTLPVFTVVSGSNSSSQHSSSATGLCSTPRGTTMNSPSSIHSWRSRNSMRKRPFTTRNISSSLS